MAEERVKRTRELENKSEENRSTSVHSSTSSEFWAELQTFCVLSPLQVFRATVRLSTCFQPVLSGDSTPLLLPCPCPRPALSPRPSLVDPFLRLSTSDLAPARMAQSQLSCAGINLSGCMLTALRIWHVLSSRSLGLRWRTAGATASVSSRSCRTAVAPDVSQLLDRQLCWTFTKHITSFWMHP